MIIKELIRLLTKEKHGDFAKIYYFEDEIILYYPSWNTLIIYQDYLKPHQGNKPHVES